MWHADELRWCCCLRVIIQLDQAMPNMLYTVFFEPIQRGQGRIQKFWVGDKTPKESRGVGLEGVSPPNGG